MNSRDLTSAMSIMGAPLETLNVLDQRIGRSFRLNGKRLSKVNNFPSKGVRSRRRRAAKMRAKGFDHADGLEHFDSNGLLTGYKNEWV